MGRVRVGLGVAAALASPVLAHLALSRWDGRTAAPALFLAQAVAVGCLVRPRGRWAALWLAALAVPTVLAWCGAARIGLAAVAGSTHAALYAALLVLFARSLRRGQVDLVTAMARRVQRGFTPAMARHTRQVTEAWCLFFAAQLAGSALLLALAPLPVWSAFVNLLNLPLAALMFAGEYGVRMVRFRGHQRVSLADTVRAFRAAGAAGATGAAGAPPLPPPGEGASR